MIDGQDVQYVMLYGTLMRGYEGHDKFDLSDRLTYVGECKIDGLLYDLGGYPGLRLVDEQQTGLVTGELYEIADTGVFRELDAFEGYDPTDREDSLYLRQVATLDDPSVDAWVYVYNQGVGSEDVIASGDWRKYTGESVG